MASTSSIRPIGLSLPTPRCRQPRRHRVLFACVLGLGCITVVAGTQMSRVFAPHWTNVQHAIVDCGGQLLALVGLFVAALRVEKLRTAENAAKRDADTSAL